MGSPDSVGSGLAVVYTPTNDHKGQRAEAYGQDLLAANGFVPYGRSDGWFGPCTREALLEFQRANGLPETGEFDEATMQALETGEIDGRPVVTGPGSDYPITEAGLPSEVTPVPHGSDSDSPAGAEAADATSGDTPVSVSPDTDFAGATDQTAANAALSQTDVESYEAHWPPSDYGAYGNAIDASSNSKGALDIALVAEINDGIANGVPAEETIAEIRARNADDPAALAQIDASLVRQGLTVENGTMLTGKRNEDGQYEVQNYVDGEPVGDPYFADIAPNGQPANSEIVNADGDTIRTDEHGEPLTGTHTWTEEAGVVNGEMTYVSVSQEYVDGQPEGGRTTSQQRSA